ncbi:MAG: DUF4382 domain-containing protein [Bacillota bacterium]|nr:DUF4382 domain-containing protein [Bacillota bacterium]MDW7684388.1 DUF4382 domain-containing protein [Bacillota bacterium]
MMQGKYRFTVIFVLFMLLLVLAGCGQNDVPAEETGTLVFTANGEEFIRDGFESKDGWEMDFSHAYITLSEITAYITDPAYDVADGWEINAQETVTLPGTFTVDLAAVDADPAILGQQDAVPAGHYNALSWAMVRAQDGPADGYMLLLTGTATRDGETINFTLHFEEELESRGGEYIGDERKGIVNAGDSADVEATFHFDHLFGDAGEDLGEELNQKALGFDPFAALAKDGELNMSSTDLSAGDYEKLKTIFLNLAHLGEAHSLTRFR